MEGAQVVCEVPCAPGGQLHISWGLGNELYIVDVPQAPSNAHDSTASCVQWGRLSPGQRRVAYDSLGKFTELQQCEADPQSREGWDAAASYCCTLGAVLAPDPGRAVDAGGDEAVALQERAVWDLLALFFLQAQQAQQGLVPQDLARWLRTNINAVCGCRAASHPLPPSLVQQLREAALPEAHTGYWGCLQRLVALGWAEEAVDLLGLHSAWLRWEGDLGAAPEADPATAAQVSALEAATLLLRRMPSLRSAASPPPAPGLPTGREFSSLPEFMAYRRGWQAECSAVLRDASLWQQCGAAAPETAEGLRSALAILSGDEVAVAAAAKGWVELLVGQLLHIYPGIKLQAELRQLVQRCYSAAGDASDEFGTLLALLLEACSDADAQTVMRACSGYPCSDWFMAHAPHLMAAHPAGAAVLGRELPHLGCDQVEFYTLDYAAALMPQCATWQVAAAYLAWCPSHGHPVLESLLSRLPLTAGEPELAGKALAVCRRHGLEDLAEELQTRQGVLSWQAGMLGAALSWLARSSDIRRIDTALAPLAAALSPAGGQSSAAAAAAAAAAAGGKGSHGSGGGSGSSGSKGALGEQEAERLLAALQPALQGIPGGSPNLALLQVHRLLHGDSSVPQEAGDSATGASSINDGSGSGSGSRVGAVVRELSRLPGGLRDGCLPLVCASLAALAPGGMEEGDVLQLLAWLQGAEARVAPASAAAAASQRQLQQSVAVARLALCRTLAASNMAAAAALSAHGLQQLQ